MMKKRGVELSIQTIAVFILILLVLAIVAYFIFKSAANVNKTTLCEDRGYKCVSKEDCSLAGIVPVLSCKTAASTTDDKVCCMP